MVRGEKGEGRKGRAGPSSGEHMSPPFVRLTRRTPHSTARLVHAVVRPSARSKLNVFRPGHALS